MKSDKYIVCSHRFIAVVIAIMVLACSLSGCGSGVIAAESAQKQLEEMRERSNEQIAALRAALMSELSEEYTQLVPAAVTIGADEAILPETDGTEESLIEAASATGEKLDKIAEAAKVELLRPVAIKCLNVMAENAGLLADEEGKGIIEQTRAEIEAQISGINDVEKLYDCMLSLEGRLFGCVSAELSEENRERLMVVPCFYVDEAQHIWLKFYTNFMLPGFADSQTGFSLQLLADNGKSVDESADSLYDYNEIVFDGAYSVRFNLSQILTTVTPEDYFASRNRVTFSVFSVDNTFGFSQGFYRMQYAEPVYVNDSDVYLTLLCIMAENA